MTDQSVTSRPSPGQDIAAAMKGLRANLRGELLQRGDEGYDGARLIWNGMFDKKPAVIARCSGTADVIHPLPDAGAAFFIAERGSSLFLGYGRKP